MKNVTFSVSLDEANKIFKALGGLPFNEVYELIGKLNEQANSQLIKSKGALKSQKTLTDNFSKHTDEFESHLKVR